MSSIRTAIFGGSFNPIHMGHILLARQVLKEGHAEEVWLMVSPHNPLKESGSLLDEGIRFRIAEKALSDDAHIKASDFEFHLPRPSYTWATLRALRASCPERDFSLLIGADNWQLFPSWAHPEEIIHNHSIIIYPREGYAVNVDSLPHNVHLLSGAPKFPCSSTDIRLAISHGEDVRGMLPPSVADEVCELYAKFGKQ